VKPLESEGLFRAKAIGWELRELPSGDPKVRVLFEVVEFYNPDTSN